MTSRLVALAIFLPSFALAFVALSVFLRDLWADRQGSCEIAGCPGTATCLLPGDGHVLALCGRCGEDLTAVTR